MNLAKIILPILFFIAAGAITSCWGQNRTNMISCEAYGNITFDGVTVDEIEANTGSYENVEQLFGTPEEQDKDVGSRSLSYTFGRNKLSFNYEFDYVSSIVIQDGNWPVVIEGHTIKVGDTLSSLKQAFGSDLIVITSEYRPGKFVFFGCENTGSEGVNIEIDPATNKVVEIGYAVYT